MRFEPGKIKTVAILPGQQKIFNHLQGQLLRTTHRTESPSTSPLRSELSFDVVKKPLHGIIERGRFLKIDGMTRVRIDQQVRLG